MTSTTIILADATERSTESPCVEPALTEARAGVRIAALTLLASTLTSVTLFVAAVHWAVS